MIESGGLHPGLSEKPHPLFTNQLRFLIFLLFLVTIYDLLRKRWLLAQQQPDKRPRKPLVLRPKREQDCRFCQVDKQKMQSPQRKLPIAWSLYKGKGGPKKQIKTVYWTCLSPTGDPTDVHPDNKTAKAIRVYCGSKKFSTDNYVFRVDNVR